MCLLCNDLWIDDHWAEVAADEVPDRPDGVVALAVHVDRRGRRLRDRAARVKLVGLVLRGHGLTLQDWEGSSYILRDPKGNATVLYHLPDVWTAAERMIGRPIDPLDPAFLAALSCRASAV